MKMFRYILQIDEYSFEYDLTISMLQGIYSYMSLLDLSNVMPKNLPTFRSLDNLSSYDNNPSDISYNVAISNPLYYKLPVDHTIQMKRELPEAVYGNNIIDGYLVSISKRTSMFVGISITTDNLSEYFSGMLLAEYVLNDKLERYPCIRLYQYNRNSDYSVVSRLNGFSILSLPKEIINLIVEYNPTQWLFVNKDLNRLSDQLKYTDPILNNSKVKARAIEGIRKQLLRKNYKNVNAILRGVQANRLDLTYLSKYLTRRTESLLKATVNRDNIYYIAIDNIAIKDASTEFIDYVVELLKPEIPNLSVSQIQVLNSSSIMVDLMDRDILYFDVWDRQALEQLIPTLSSDKLILLTKTAMKTPLKLHAISFDSYLGVLFTLFLNSPSQSYLTDVHMKFVRWLCSNIDDSYQLHLSSIVDLLYRSSIVPDINLVYDTISSLLEYQLTPQSLSKLEDLILEGIDKYGFPADMFEQLQLRIESLLED